MPEPFKKLFEILGFAKGNLPCSSHHMTFDFDMQGKNVQVELLELHCNSV